MKMRIKLLAALAISILAPSIASATVTIQLSQINVGRLTGFGNNAGVATNGMSWGILVDTTGNGFSGGSYDVFNNSTNGFLKIGALDSDDYFITSGLTTQSLSATNGDPGGAGGVTSIGPFTTGGLTGIGQNDAFAVIWFETSPVDGSYYGLFTDPSLLMPSDPSTTSFAANFNSPTADPVKSANLQFGGAAVPEPSRLILLGLGFAGLIWRRKR